MKHLRIRAGVSGLLATLCVFVAASAAFGSPQVSRYSVSNADNSLAISIESTGDAGAAHGNVNFGTSPVWPAPDDFFYWLNQDVRVYDLQLVDPLDNDAPVEFDSATRAVNSGGGFGTASEFTSETVVSAEGVYSIAASGYDSLDPSTLTSGEIVGAFGIDKTLPSSSSDALPLYVGQADVTISASDALSGVANVVTSVDDGPRQYLDAPDGPGVYQVVKSFGPGTHTLEWAVFDNAGNAQYRSVSFLVRPAGYVPSITLRTQRLDREGHRTRIYGTVTSAPAAQSVTLVIQRKVGRSWERQPRPRATVPAFGTDYSVIGGSPRTGTTV